MDLIVQDPPSIDLWVFQRWLCGFTESSAANARLEQHDFGLDPIRFENANLKEIVDQYRLFSIMERWFHQPHLLPTQPLFQFDPELVLTLVQRYYAIDDFVFRRFIGKKLNNKLKKELDEFCGPIYSLNSIKRQFANLSRIFRLVEDQQDDVVSIIKSRFLLSDELAFQYGRAVFLCDNRYETMKRPALVAQPYGFYDNCAMHLMTLWCPQCCAIDYEKSFLEQIREIKLSFHQELLAAFKASWERQLSTRIDPGKLHSIKLHSFMRSLLSLGSSLSQTRDHRNFFIDLFDRIVEPCRRASFTLNEFHALFETLAHQFVLLVQSKERGWYSTEVYEAVPGKPWPGPISALLTTHYSAVITPALLAKLAEMHPNKPVPPIIPNTYTASFLRLLVGIHTCAAPLFEGSYAQIQTR